MDDSLLFGNTTLDLPLVIYSECISVHNIVHSLKFPLHPYLGTHTCTLEMGPRTGTADPNPIKLWDGSVQFGTVLDLYSMLKVNLSEMDLN